MKEDKFVILIADSDQASLAVFQQLAIKHPQFTIHYASTSQEATSIFTHHHIDLAFVDLYLHPVHGLEILKKMKSMMPGADCIITSFEPMIQNYRAALSHGALDFIPKPYSFETIETLIDDYQKGSYKTHQLYEIRKTQAPFLLKEHSTDTYLKFWGTRGSHSVSGTQYLRFGGNTPCLEIRSQDSLVIIDAGTGLTNLGRELVHDNNPQSLELLIGHTHLDHMAGLPGFAPLHDSRFNITLRAPINFYKNTKDLLKEMLSHAFFPVDLEEVKASLKFKELETLSPFTVGPMTIDAHYTYHPGTTLSFKIKIADFIIGYITDNEALMGYSGDPKAITSDHPLLKPHASFIEFFKNCDILIHEAQYHPKIYPEKIGWGHSSIYNAAVLVKYINPKVWIITHHDPEDSDELLQKKYQLIVDACSYLDIPCSVRIAYDGLKINL